jgi:hypothetical protein
MCSTQGERRKLFAFFVDLFQKKRLTLPEIQPLAQEKTP